MALELKHFTPEQAAEIIAIIQEEELRAYREMRQQELANPKSAYSRIRRASPEELAEYYAATGMRPRPHHGVDYVPPTVPVAPAS